MNTTRTSTRDFIEIIDQAAKLFGAIQVRRTDHSVSIELPDDRYPIFEATWEDAIEMLTRAIAQTRRTAKHKDHSPTNNCTCAVNGGCLLHPRTLAG